MTSRDRDDALVERLLTGRLLPGDLDGPDAPLVRLLDAARQGGWSELVGPAPVRPATSGRRIVGRAMLLGTAASIAATTAMAAAGVLPDPIQDFAHDVADAVGLDIPAGNEEHGADAGDTQREVDREPVLPAPSVDEQSPPGGEPAPQAEGGAGPAPEADEVDDAPSALPGPPAAELSDPLPEDQDVPDPTVPPEAPSVPGPLSPEPPPGDDDDGADDEGADAEVDDDDDGEESTTDP